MATSNIQNVNSATVYTSQFTPQSYAASFTFPWATTPNVSVAVTGVMTVVSPSGVPANGEFQLLLTNTSGSAKTITFSAGWVDGDGNTLAPVTLQNNGSSLMLLTAMSGTVVSASVSGSGSGSAVTKLITQIAHGFVVGDWLYVSAASTYAKSANTSAVLVETIGVVSQVVDANSFKITIEGYVSGLTGLTAASAHFISGTAGAITTTEPALATSYRKAVFIGDTTTSGWVKLYPATAVAGQSSVVNYVNVEQHSAGVATNMSTVTSPNTTTPYVLAATTARVSLTGATVVGSMTVNASDQIVIPVAGSYSVACTINISNSQGGIAQWAQLVRNGATVVASGNSYNNVASSAEGINITYSGVFAVGDTLDIRLGCGAAGAIGVGSYSLNVVQIGASPVPMSLVGEYVAPIYLTGGNLTTTGTTSAAAIDVLSIVIPTAGTWAIDWSLRGGNPGTANAGLQSALYDSSNVLLANSETTSVFSNGTTNVQANGKGFYIVTTTGATTYKVRAWSNSVVGGLVISDNNGRSFVTASKISGFIPSSGQTVDYVQVKRATDQTSFAAADDVLWNTVIAGNIPLNTTTGVFTLTAGKTYELEASINTTGSSGQDTTYIWTDTSNVAIGNGTGARAIGATYASNEAGQSIAKVIYTPSTNQQVKLRVTFSANNAVLKAANSYAKITQIGSSAVIAGPYPGTWTSYTPTVTATTTAPTLATTHTKNASYSVQGKTMFLNWSYFAAAAAGATGGTGVYKFPIPAGYAIDTAVAVVPTTIGTAGRNGADGVPIGSGLIQQTGTSGNGIVVALSSTELGIYVDVPNAALSGAGNYTWNTAFQHVAFTAQIPLV